MASDGLAPGFVPGRGYTQEDWDEVSDNPEITEEQWATARPLAEAMPEIVEAMERRRGLQKAPTKDLVSLRLDKDVLATLRAGGSGWQSRVNEMLRKGLGLNGSAASPPEPDVRQSCPSNTRAEGIRIGERRPGARWRVALGYLSITL